MLQLRSKKSAGLYLISFPFVKVIAYLVEENVRIENRKLDERVERKPSHI